MKKNISTLTALSQKAKYAGLFLALLAASPVVKAQNNPTVTVDGKPSKTSTETENLMLGKIPDFQPTKNRCHHQTDDQCRKGGPADRNRNARYRSSYRPVGDSKQGLVPGAAGGTAELTRFESWQR